MALLQISRSHLEDADSEANFETLSIDGLKSDDEDDKVNADEGQSLDMELQSLNLSMEVKSPRAWSLKSVPHVGLVMAVVSSLFFSLCSLIVRKVSTVNPLEHSTMRFVGVLLPSISIVVYSRQNPLGQPGSRVILFFRGVLGSAGLMFQFYSFQHMPLADASVLIFSSPVFVTIFARIFLKESCGPAQVVSVVVTLVGVVLISRPPFLFGSEQHYSMENLLGALSALSGTICSANVYILIRKLKALHYAVIMMTFAVIGIVMSQSFSVAFGTLCLPCSFHERLLLLLLGVFSFCGQFLLTKALQFEHAGPVSICRTADIVFAFIWQVTFLSEVPSGYSIVGAVLVTLSVLVMGFRKWVLELPTSSSIRKRFWTIVA